MIYLKCGPKLMGTWNQSENFTKKWTKNKHMSMESPVQSNDPWKESSGRFLLLLLLFLTFVSCTLTSVKNKPWSQLRYDYELLPVELIRVSNNFCVTWKLSLGW